MKFNGIPIEFSWNVEGIDVRKYPVMGDAKPTDAAREGADPQPGHWPSPRGRTPKQRRIAYKGAGSELFHGKTIAASGAANKA